jgi:hypothetical protein
MTGIETIMMKKPFLFNHEMKHATLISNDEIEIANTILNLPAWDDDKSRKAINYYKNRNSTLTFERNMKCYIPNMKFHSDLLHVLKCNGDGDNTDYKCISADNDEIKVLNNLGLINNKKYRLIFSGYSDGHAKLDIKDGKNIGGIANIEEFETCCYIDFVTTVNTEVHFIMKTFNECCKIFIRELHIYSF